MFGSQYVSYHSVKKLLFDTQIKKHLATCTGSAAWYSLALRCSGLVFLRSSTADYIAVSVGL